MEKSEDVSSMSEELYRKMARNLICGNWHVQVGDQTNYLAMLNYEGQVIHQAVMGDPDLDEVIDCFEKKIIEIETNKTKGENA